MVLGNVWVVNSTGFADIDQAYALVETALSAVQQVRDGAFWKLLPDDQLEFGRGWKPWPAPSTRRRCICESSLSLVMCAASGMAMLGVWEGPAGWFRRGLWWSG